MVHGHYDLVCTVDLLVLVESLLDWVVSDYFVAEAPGPHLEECVEEAQWSH